MRQQKKMVGPPGRQRERGPLGSETAAGYVRAVKTFLTWAYKEQYLERDLARHIQKLKFRKKVIDPLRDEELDKVLKPIADKTVRGARIMAMVLLMFDSLLRASEVANLMDEHVHIKEGWVKIVGKGDKERAVPIGADTRQAMIRYRALRPEDITGSGRLFLSPYGRPVSARSIYQVVHRLAGKAGVKRLHPHLFRHSGATQMIENGADAFEVQDILGHASLEMTRRYVNASAKQRQKAHQSPSPMANNRRSQGGQRGFKRDLYVI